MKRGLSYKGDSYRSRKLLIFPGISRSCDKTSLSESLRRMILATYINEDLKRERMSERASSDVVSPGKKSAGKGATDITSGRAA